LKFPRTLLNLVFSFFLLLLLARAALSEAVNVAFIPIVANAPVATLSPAATETPIDTPEPTATPLPTDTPAPTPTTHIIPPLVEVVIRDTDIPQGWAIVYDGYAELDPDRPHLLAHYMAAYLGVDSRLLWFIS
jgi:hypothetical protein